LFVFNEIAIYEAKNTYERLKKVEVISWVFEFGIELENQNKRDRWKVINDTPLREEFERIVLYSLKRRW
jgi:hypothetical protein